MILDNLITEAQYAAMRGVCVRTVMRERALRQSPDFIKLGKSIFYRPEAIDAWIIAQEQTSSAAEREAAADTERMRTREKARRVRNDRIAGAAALHIIHAQTKMKEK
jgi:hypothetical protein